MVISADIVRQKMEINQIISKPDLILGYLKLIARIALTISSALLFTSTILLIVYKGQCFSLNSHTGDIIWPTIIITGYSLLYSLIIILAFLIYKTYKQNLTWTSIRKEILLLILTGLLLTIFYFVNSYMVSNYY